jgi:Flp pilus assembly pilin Flp
MDKRTKTLGRKNESGQGMTEYIIIVALIAITSIAVIKIFGDSIKFQMAETIHGFLGNKKPDVDRPELGKNAVARRTMRDFARANDNN